MACEISSFFVERGSVVARYRSVVWSFSVRQVEQHFVDIAPAPAFRRIVAFDHRMGGGMEMRGRMLVRRIVAAADMAAGTADPQMQPLAAAFQALLATERAWGDRLNAGDMAAAFGHPDILFLERRFRDVAEKAVQRGHPLRALADRAADAFDRAG